MERLCHIIMCHTVIITCHLEHYDGDGEGVGDGPGEGGGPDRGVAPGADHGEMRPEPDTWETYGVKYNKFSLTSFFLLVAFVFCTDIVISHDWGTRAPCTVKYRCTEPVISHLRGTRVPGTVSQYCTVTVQVYRTSYLSPAGYQSAR